MQNAFCDATPEDSLTNRITQFNDILITAAKAHVGKCKRGPRSNDWMTPEVKLAIKKRNRLRREGAKKRKEWVEACQEAQKLAMEAKECSWADFVEDLEHQADPSKVWNLIKSLSGTPGDSAPNEAMIHEGKVITTSAGKANAFMSHYASVSRLSFTKEERVRNRECKGMLRSSSVDGEQCREFSMRELESAINKMKAKGAAGPDDIPPTFLKALGPVAKEHLLEIFNESFRSGFCAQVWRNAIIISLLKAGKPASQLASYRPVSLTSL